MIGRLVSGLWSFVFFGFFIWFAVKHPVGAVALVRACWSGVLALWGFAASVIGVFT